MDTLLRTQKSLERLGYTVKVFDDKAQATDYLASSLQGKRIGLGGSVSIGQMGLYERLQESNTVLCFTADLSDPILKISTGSL